MYNILYWFKSRYKQLKNTLLFYTNIMAFVMVAFGLFMLWAEGQGLSKWMSSRIPFLVIHDIDTARTILGTLVGALISLMVFSFSMVMLVLTQAASNFSPRLLPGLVSNKKHQRILGFYIGSISYSLLLMINVLPGDKQISVPGSAIFLAVVFGMICLALFIYFINSISQSIQIGNIYADLNRETLKSIESIKSNEKFIFCEKPTFDDWYCINAQKSGYVNNYSLGGLIGLTKENETKVFAAVEEGSFIIRGEPIIKTSKKIEEDNQVVFQKMVTIADEEDTYLNYSLGVKQITEIILKAMSPGINDPGTALTGINYLKVIFSELTQVQEVNAYENEAGIVYFKSHQFGRILHSSMVAIRRYTKEDFSVMAAIIKLLKVTEHQTENKRYLAAIELEKETLQEDIEASISNSRDRDRLLNRLSKQMILEN